MQHLHQLTSTHKVLESALSQDGTFGLGKLKGITVIEAPGQGILVMTDERHFALVGGLITHEKLEAISINDDSVFGVSSKHVTRPIKTSVGLLSRRMLDRIHDARYLFYSQHPSFNQFGRHFDDVDAIAEASSARAFPYVPQPSSSYTAAAPSPSGGYAPAYNQAYSCNLNYYNTHWLRLAHSKKHGKHFDKLKLGAKFVGGKHGEDNLEAHVYNFDYAGNILDVYSDDASVQVRNGVSIVFRGANNFCFRKPSMPLEINRLCVYKQFVIFVYNDYSVVAKPLRWLEQLELELYEEARNIVRPLATLLLLDAAIEVEELKEGKEIFKEAKLLDKLAIKEGALEEGLGKIDIAKALKGLKLESLIGASGAKLGGIGASEPGQERALESSVVEDGQIIPARGISNPTAGGNALVIGPDAQLTLTPVERPSGVAAGSSLVTSSSARGAKRAPASVARADKQSAASARAAQLLEERFSN